MVFLQPDRNVLVILDLNSLMITTGSRLRKAGVGYAGHSMNATTFAALRLLTDGEFRSGQDIARRLGVSRASVWNALHALDGAGIEIFKVRGRGGRARGSAIPPRSCSR